MPAGRPTKFKPEYIKLAKNYCSLGATDEQLADLFEVDVSTIGNWKNSHPEFLEALKESKENLDSQVEASLFRRAQGFMRVKEVYNPEGLKDLVQEEVAPDTTACIFWLKNRQPAKWRDKQEHEHSGKDGAPLVAVLNVGKPAENK